MRSKLIVMLTHNDQTVENARDYFDECRDLPVDYWGFKNVGISEQEMCRLNASIKNMGKKTFLEVVTYTEESCMASAKFACENNFDFLLGTLFYPSVWDYLQKHSIQYYPFVGEVSGSPSVLAGKIESMITQANNFHMNNVPGVDILAYRYINGSPVQLAQKIVNQIKPNAVIAGSINCIERIKIVNEINPWAFTIGSALFTQNFAIGAGFRVNLEKVLETIGSLNDPAA